MVEGFKSGFYTTSSQAKKEGKQETKTQLSPLSQPQSILNQQSGIQQEERKQVLKKTQIDTPISAEKPRKQMKSAPPGGDGIQSLQPDEHGIAHQSSAKPLGRGQKTQERQRQINGKV